MDRDAYFAARGEISATHLTTGKANRSGSDTPDKYGPRLRLAEQLGARLFFASNFILEQEVQGEM